MRNAAEGRTTAAARFVQAYEPVVRRYLEARWRGTPLAAQVDDAVQEVFLECFKEEGLLAKADPHTIRSFRAFFLGLVRNVSRRFEERRRRRREEGWNTLLARDREAAEARLSRLFDREWARALLRQAVARLMEAARRRGAPARRRVELLRLHFYADRPIREIARAWDMDPAVLHRQYARARREFAAALRQVLREHNLEGPEEELLALLAGED